LDGIYEPEEHTRGVTQIAQAPTQRPESQVEGSRKALIILEITIMMSMMYCTQRERKRLSTTHPCFPSGGPGENHQELR